MRVPVLLTYSVIYFLVTDIDECVLDTDGCEHNCSNTVGSFICSCNTGYAVALDDKSCIGESLFIMWHNHSLHTVHTVCIYVYHIHISDYRDALCYYIPDVIHSFIAIVESSDELSAHLAMNITLPNNYADSSLSQSKNYPSPTDTTSIQTVKVPYVP